MMIAQNNKCVMIVDDALPLGLIANTAAILGITIGKMMPDAVGPDVVDKSGSIHLGIIEIPVPILKAGADVIKGIREELHRGDYGSLTVVDFSDLAQGCKQYDEYIEKMANALGGQLNYLGIALCGEKKKVGKLTGSLPLLR